MMKKLFSIFSTIRPCATKFVAQGFVLNKLNLSWLLGASVELGDSGITTTSTLGALLSLLADLINSLVFIIAKYILLFIDFCQVIVYKIAGISTDLTKIVNMPIFRFLLNDTVLKTIGAIMILGLILLVLVTIVAIVKNEYEASLDDKIDPKKTAYKTVGKSFVTLFLMFITPFIIVISIVFSSVLLSSVNNVLNSNGTQQSTLGGTVFVTSAYNANNYRNYANGNIRLPIIINFDDPYQNGSAKYFTSEELKNIYDGWNGKELYNKFARKEFASFKDTLVYKNGKIYNANSYSDYEKFVATSEQYNVMADFIDYAMAHDIKFYIKDSQNKDIDWSRQSSNIKISDGVYDPMSGKISITYNDLSDLSPYNNYYTITFDASSAYADTPIKDAVSTISLVLGLNSVLNGTYSSSTQNTTIGPVKPTTTSSLANLNNVSKNIEDALSQLNSASSSSSTNQATFRILERVAGSINVVRWQTEKALFDGVEYTVYTLKKIVKNRETGANEVRSTVNVAKKSDSLDTKYYVVSETKNQYGYYDYTNITLDYFNDGTTYFDTLTPVYKRVTWPQKLYNDLKVIYSDIDFDNFITYDNWADALGTYFKTNNNVSSGDVSSFATTLIHPLGLIMSELFLGTKIEGENQTTSSFSFASAYTKDVLKSLTKSIGGEFDYANMSYQVDRFISLFNSQFASVIESLKKIEKFDLDEQNYQSVEGYVYKAYLASIMFSTDYGQYLANIAQDLQLGEKLLDLIAINSGSLTYDEQGNSVYRIEQLVDSSGNVQPLYYQGVENSGKAVYNSKGLMRYTANILGQLTSSGYYIPKDGVSYYIKEIKNNSNEVVAYQYWVFVGTQVMGADYGYLNASTLSTYDDYSVEKITSHNEDGSVVREAKVKYIGLDESLNGKIVTVSFEEDEEDNSIIAKAVEKSVEVRVNFHPLFSDFFTTYFTISDDGAFLYTNEPTDGDTTKQSNTITKTVYSFNTDDIQKVQGNLYIRETNKKYSTDTCMDDYCLPEVLKEVKASTKYLTYGELPETYQNYIDRMIEKIEADVKKGGYDEPVYLKFLKDYKNDDVEMASVMESKSISSSLAQRYLKDYDKIVDNIKYYENALNEPNETAKIKEYSTRLKQEKEKLYKLKKYYIVYGISSYVSTQVSSGFNVIVNSHPYYVTQGKTQRELLELIYGNKLLNTSLLGNLKNGTTYDNLDAYDKSALLEVDAKLRYYASTVGKIVSGKNIDSCKLFKGALSEQELRIINSIVEAKTGVNPRYSNKSLKALTNAKKEDLKALLTKTASDLNVMLDNYKNNRTINSGIYYNITIDEAYAIIYKLATIAVGDEELYFVESDYDGLLDGNFNSFSLLRSFLTDFGSLCFDLSRNSNLSTIGEDGTVKILDYIDEFVELLSTKLAGLDLGSSFDNIQYISGNVDIKTHDGKPANGLNKFAELNTTSKEYIYAVFNVYNKKIEAYQNELEELRLAKEYADRYIRGRYKLQSASLIYSVSLPKYLNWFKYNADITSDDFIEKYVYEGYASGTDSVDERLYYYNLYLEAFDELKLGTDGLYFETLNEIQQKVIEDLKLYLESNYNDFVNSKNEDYNKNLKYYNILNDFIENKITFGETRNLTNTSDSNVELQTTSELVQANQSLLNLINLLDYVGLDYDINKTLGDYRLEAMQSLITFTERAGENGASVQARYLTLLYLTCSDYTTSVDGSTHISIDTNTKNTILKLAGLENRPEENLVGLKYELVNTSSVSDEKYGSVYIICTYNADSELYEPFVFASGKDSYGTPSTTFYSSSDGSIKYYPIVAKGLVTADGLPTAIREVDGYIEFYRDDAVIVEPATLNLQMYYMSVEDVAINYNPVNFLVNGLTKLFSKDHQSLAEKILNTFPIIVSSKNLNFCYGKTTNYVYHLDNGEFTLNYMFYRNSGIDMNLLYRAGNLNVIILLIGTFILASSLISAMFGVIRNLYETVILVIIYPGVFALYPLKDEYMGKWRKAFIDKLLVCFSYIIAINGFFIILNILQTMDISLTLSEDSLRELSNTWLFGNLDMQGVLNILFTFMCFIVACSLLKGLPALFGGLVGGGNVVKVGQETKKMVDINAAEASYFTSGRAVEDMVLHNTIDKMRAMPLAPGSDARFNNNQKQQLQANKRAVEAYRKSLKAGGISDPVIDKAVKAYQDSLNRQLDAERQRRNAQRESRNYRIKQHQSRVKEITKNTEEKKKNKICPKCKTVCSPKSKNCPVCGTKL